MQGCCACRWLLLILTLALDFVRVATPDYLPRVLLDLERSPLWTLGFLLVEHGHHRAHLQAVEDAGAGLRPVQHPGGHDWTGGPSATGTTGRTSAGLLSAAIEAAAEPGSTHPH